MTTIWEWLEGENDFCFSIKRLTNYEQKFTGNPRYTVFTIPTQHFYVDHLSEITAERLQMEKERWEREKDMTIGELLEMDKANGAV